MITHTYRVIRRRSKRDPWVEFQYLLRTTRLFGIPVWAAAIDWEEIPGHVVIARGTLGYDSSGWRSKFYDVIEEQQRCAD